jgi:hypothetical protein
MPSSISLTGEATACWYNSISLVVWFDQWPCGMTLERDGFGRAGCVVVCRHPQCKLTGCGHYAATQAKKALSSFSTAQDLDICPVVTLLEQISTVDIQMLRKSEQNSYNIVPFVQRDRATIHHPDE